MTTRFRFVRLRFECMSFHERHSSIQTNCRISCELFVNETLLFWFKLEWINIYIVIECYIPVWWVIDIWIGHVLHWVSHFRCDRRPPFSHLRYRCPVAHFSVNTNRPNCHAPSRQYRAASSWFAMNFHWILWSMHNLFANCCLLWKFDQAIRQTINELCAAKRLYKMDHK